MAASIRLKIAGDFAAKSVDNGHDFRCRLVRRIDHREDTS